MAKLDRQSALFAYQGCHSACQRGDLRFFFFEESFCMPDEYYYSGSDFYADDDAPINSAYTDAREQPCHVADCASMCARRYGQWWTLTGVKPDCARPDEAEQRLQRCYSLVVTLNHPNITRAVAMMQTPLFDDECFIEEYIDGQSLHDFMHTDPDEMLRRKLLEQIVDALLYCHHKGVVHGNLKAHTVMVTHQDHVAKLVALACEGEPQDDIRALADIIDTLRLPEFKSLAKRCRAGQVANMEEVVKSLKHPRSLKWLPKGLLLVALLVAIVAAAFWAGHRASLARDSRLADSLPLPNIYFSDTVGLSALNDQGEKGVTRATLTGALIYGLDRTSPVPGNIPEEAAVDLGLSVLWAPFNLGCADADINNLGGQFTWCDTLGAGDFVPMDKYWPPGRPMIDIAGTGHDRVRRIWSGRWRMPTLADWQELVLKCKWILVLQRGVPPGYKVHGPSGAEIFLPLAGYGFHYRGHDVGLVGHYWSSTPMAGADRQAHALRIDTAAVDIDDALSLEHSLSIRPVIDKTQ